LVKGNLKAAIVFRISKTFWKKRTNQLILSKVLKSQMKFKSYMSILLKNFKMQKILMGQLKKSRLISSGGTDLGLSNYIFFR